MDRLNVIASHLVSNSHKNPSDVVICGALRSPLTKSRKGGLAKCAPEDILAPVLKELIKQTGIPLDQIGDICIGNVLQPGAGAVSSRMAQFLADIPDTVPLHVVNRQCSSGLQAVADIAASIRAGYINVGIAGGVESMSQNDMNDSLNPEKISESVFEHETARNCLMPMGLTSENVASKYSISRKDQDEFAAHSHAKALNAAKNGYFLKEIVPICVKSDGSQTIISKDDGIRESTTVEGLAKLKAAFQKDGTTTAGNSSQVSDGAAVVLLASREAAQKLALPILAKFVNFKAVGCDPTIMGIGPAVAIPAVLNSAKMKIDKIDIFELNEAFASQAVYCARKLEIPQEKINPKGGAIALGHPLGCTGARQVATLIPELKRQNKRYGIVSMCIGTGMGAAAIIENEGA
eukprot:GHVL01007513.1.p1 GENE.GHVL01007513.1~~GHVL01007513.1.p1  ORF type:complete len:406 (+),score=72.15 GHVL01007513.1:36-1253(+)